MTREPGKSVSGSYIFDRDSNGRLQMVGDFEGLYRDQPDPWGQSGSDERLKAYYQHSRAILIETIARHITVKSILEVGCGHGHVTRLMADARPGAAVSGMDISPTAAKQAQNLFPELLFSQGDIATPEPPSGKRYHMIILNQMLWYVLDRLDNVFSNCHKMLFDDGLLVISTGFLKQQEYGLNVVDGFAGLLDVCIGKQSANWRVLQARYDDSETFVHNDGIVVLRRI